MSLILALRAAGGMMPISTTRSFLFKLTTRIFDEQYMHNTWGEPAWKRDGWEVQALSTVKTVSPEQYDLMSPADQLQVVKTPKGEKLTLVHIQRRLQAELGGKSALSFNMQVRNRMQNSS